MGFPNHSFLLAQWTSEKMNLGTEKKGDGGMDGGRERNTTIKIKQVKWNKHDRTPTKKKMAKFVRVFLAFMLYLCYI